MTWSPSTPICSAEWECNPPRIKRSPAEHAGFFFALNELVGNLRSGMDTPCGTGENSRTRFITFAPMKTWLLLFLGFITTSLLAQETTLLEPGKSPFEGEISYKIAYSNTGLVQKDAPDSMVIAFGNIGWAAKWFGGTAKKLKAELIFSLEDSTFWWVNHKEWVAYRMDSAYQTPKTSMVKLAKKESKTILGQKSTKVALKTGESTQTFWLADSLQLTALPDSFPPVIPPVWQLSKYGLPLGMEQTSRSGKSTTTAVEIRPMAIPADRFRVPTGYTRQTFDFFSYHPNLGE